MPELEKSWHSKRKAAYKKYLGDGSNTWYYLRYFVISIKENQKAKPLNHLKWDRRFDTLKNQEIGVE